MDMLTQSPVLRPRRQRTELSGVLVSDIGALSVPGAELNNSQDVHILRERRSTLDVDTRCDIGSKAMKQ